MDTIFLIIGALIILWLALSVAFHKGRDEGYQEGNRKAQTQVSNGYHGDDAVYGCLKVLAAIGFLTICGSCLYMGLAISAWAK